MVLVQFLVCIVCHCRVRQLVRVKGTEEEIWRCAWDGDVPPDGCKPCAGCPLCHDGGNLWMVKPSYSSARLADAKSTAPASLQKEKTSKQKEGQEAGWPSYIATRTGLIALARFFRGLGTRRRTKSKPSPSGEDHKEREDTHDYQEHAAMQDLRP